MFSSLKKGRIIKGIPDYLLIVSMLVPVIMLSGAGIFSNVGSFSTGEGYYNYLLRDWRSWSEEEWDRFYDMIQNIYEMDDLPPEYIEFSRDVFSNELERESFLKTFNEYIMSKHGNIE